MHSTHMHVLYALSELIACSPDTVGPGASTLMVPLGRRWAQQL